MWGTTEDVNMADMRVTLQQVAESAGVSLKTASRVVNQEQYVSGPTAARVQRAIRELGYRPDSSARNLARGRRFRMAGLLITTLENPQVVALARGVEQVLREAGYSLVIASTDEDPEVERALLEEFLERGVESAVVVPSGSEHQHLSGAASRMSLVLAHRIVEGVDADMVAPDDFRATHEAVVTLLGEGHRRIAFVGDHAYFSNIQQRYEGFKAAHDDFGVAIDAGLVSMGHQTAESSSSCVNEMLFQRTPPSAIFASKNLNCLGTLLALRGKELDVAVVGFDELAEAAYLGVPVRLLSYDQSELGRIAAGRLLARANGDVSAPRRIVMPVTSRHVGSE